MLEQFRQQVSPFLKARRWYIAYSGGLDSHTLLHLLVQLREHQAIPELIAVHVNHQLQSQADSWQAHCQCVCDALQVDFRPFVVTVADIASPEQAARDARYQVFESLLQEDDLLLMAHHADDQAETLLYRLFRGAGVKGLAGMPPARQVGDGKLLRPLLSFTRAELSDYAEHQALRWIDDPTNHETIADRNYIRHRLLPVIAERWPMALSQIGRSARHLAEGQALLQELAQEDLQCAESGDDGEPWLDCSELLNLSAARLKNALRFWLSSHDVSVSALQLQQVMEMLSVKVDASPVVTVGSVVLRRYQMRLYVSREVVGFDIVSWNGESVCCIPGYGQLKLSEPLFIELEVIPRKGGERLRLVGELHSRKLKTLLQEAGVPPWRREYYPLIYYRGELIAAAELFLCEAAVSLLQQRTITRVS